MREVIAVSIALTADARNVRQARQVLRGALLRSGAEHLMDEATLVLSEIVTNAFLHAGTTIRLDLWSTDAAVRVEVEDGVTHLPAQRSYAVDDGAGRGLQLLDALVDRWGTITTGTGKTVWFEIGEFETDPGHEPDRGGPLTVDGSGRQHALAEAPPATSIC